MGRSKPRTTTISRIDDSTGELHLIEVQKTVGVETTTEEFFQVYCRLIASVYELKYADDIKILIKFCEIAEFNTGKVLIPAAERKVICEQLKMQTSNMSKSLKRLKDKDLITGEKGSYLINPAIFWKGEQKIRAQILKEEGLSVMFKFRSE